MKQSYGILIMITGCFIFSARLISCKEKKTASAPQMSIENTDSLFKYDSSKIPDNKYGEAVKYGRQLMMETNHFIGPNGINGQFLGNKMNCTNCHQDGGLKPYSFNLVTSFKNYPQYRAREGKVLSLAERINNCITHPHLGKPLPLDGKEMIAFMSYFKWLHDSLQIPSATKGLKNLPITFPEEAASPERGEKLYALNCMRCHGANGEGQLKPDTSGYIYPPIWGLQAYQPGSSMHRIIMQARWLLANMPYDLASSKKPVLTPAEALDIAAFVNDDNQHMRFSVTNYEYPNFEEKAIDYDRGPYNDTFSERQHKYGPFQPIIDYRKSKNLTYSY